MRGMSNQDVEIIAGAVGAPPIMRTSVAVAGQLVTVWWSGTFTMKPTPAGAIPIGIVLQAGGLVSVRVQNVDAILNYIKTAALPPVGTAVRYLSVNPVVPGMVPVALIKWPPVTEATFKHVMQMLGIDFMTNLEPGSAAAQMTHRR